MAILPSPVLTFLAGLAKFLDRIGHIPKSVKSTDVNFASVLISNIGSIGGPVIYHHLNDYGTTSAFISIGKMYEREEKDGKTHTYLPIGITLDERISFGYQFVASLKLLKYYLENAEVLFEPFLEKGPVEE